MRHDVIGRASRHGSQPDVLGHAHGRALHAVAETGTLRFNAWINCMDDVSRVSFHAVKVALGTRRKPGMLRGSPRLRDGGWEQALLHRRSLEASRHMTDMGLDHVGLLPGGDHATADAADHQRESEQDVCHVSHN